MKEKEESKNRYISLEIIFSIFVIIFLIFIITIVCINIKQKTLSVNKSSEATIILTNILENINSRSYNDFSKYIEEVSIIGISKKIEDNIQYVTISGDECQDKFFGTEIPDGFDVELKIENLNNDFDIIKNIDISVFFEVNGKSENVNVSTVIQREKIDECNLPNFGNLYFDDIGINLEDYDVIPIKYSNDTNSYVTTTSGDPEWYNYSAKEWAKVVVFSKDGDDLEDLFIDSNGIVKYNINYDKYNLNINNYIYVWIPNFSIKNDKTYFRYGAGKNSIKMDFQYVNGKYLYLNTISDEIEDISKECSFDGIYGVWRKLGNNEDIYYKNFNLTKYGPINIH